MCVFCKVVNFVCLFDTDSLYLIKLAFVEQEKPPEIDKSKLSKKKLKKLTRLSVAELKQVSELLFLKMCEY